VPSDGTAQEAYQYTGIVKADNVDETWPKWQHVEIAQEAYHYTGIVKADNVDET
jgi:hypothetical protein